MSRTDEDRQVRSGSNSTVVASVEPPTARTHLGVVHAGDDVRSSRRSRRRRRSLNPPGSRRTRADHLDRARGGRSPPRPGPPPGWRRHGFQPAGAGCPETSGNPEPVEQATDLREQRRRLRQRGVERPHDRRAPDLARDRRERARSRRFRARNQIASSDATDGDRRPLRPESAFPNLDDARSRARTPTNHPAALPERAPTTSRTSTAIPARAVGPSTTAADQRREQGARDQTDEQPAEPEGLQREAAAGSRRCRTARRARAGQVEGRSRSAVSSHGAWVAIPGRSGAATLATNVVTIAHISDPRVGSPYFCSEPDEPGDRQS